jgi:two-component system sensor histidine kinase/response regulator
MTATASLYSDASAISARADELFAATRYELHARTDRLFAGLMGFQWLGGIVFALWVSPIAWYGATSRTHVHVWAAVVLGGIISLFPALLALLRPGRPSTRYTIAAAQMLMGALLIHLTGGRIETHFHVFGSLAFLAFYRDWKVLIPATIVVAADHMLRGIFWPQSVYGVFVASSWRWIEHAAWVLFEDVFLFVSCRRSVIEMRQTAERTAALEQEIGTRQRTEAELRVSQREAEAATRAKSDFLASMSHELRTPLNAIILYSELLEEEAQDARATGPVKDLQRIQASGHHLLELINGILDLSKIEAGKMTLDIDSFGLEALAKDVADTLAPLVQKNNNRLDISIAADAAMMVTDQTKMRQILLNLLGNACKFTRDGSISLAVVRETGDWMRFVVSDTGVGMTGEQTRTIFEPFTQADVTTTRRYGGTGLGLAIVSRFCGLMGGTIAVDSAPGQGSRFTVRLPVRADAEAQPPVDGRAA